jgi:hypothetical protein
MVLRSIDKVQHGSGVEIGGVEPDCQNLLLVSQIKHKESTKETQAQIEASSDTSIYEMLTP